MSQKGLGKLPDYNVNIYKILDRNKTIISNYIQIDRIVLKRQTSYESGSSTQIIQFNFFSKNSNGDDKRIILNFFKDKNCKGVIQEYFNIQKNENDCSYNIKITEHLKNKESKIVQEILRKKENLSNNESLLLENMITDFSIINEFINVIDDFRLMGKISEDDFKYYKNQFEKVANNVDQLIEELSNINPALNQVIELDSKILDPKFMVISDTKDKKLAFNPDNKFNYINSKGQHLISFSEETNNPIKVNNFENELIIIPEMLVELNSSEKGGTLLPLDKLDDLIIDVISSFRIANSDTAIDLNDPNCIKVLRNQRPLHIPENKLVGLVYKTEKPTKKQKEEFLNHFNRLIKTDYFHSYKDQGSFYLNKSGIEGKEDYEFEVTGTILDGKVTKRVNPNKTETRIYTITGMPAFLEHALILRQIKSIPISLLNLKSVQSSNDFNLVKNYLGKRIGNTLSKLNKKKGFLDIKDYDLIINIDTLFNESGIKFEGTGKRVKRTRYINKIKKHLDEIINLNTEKSKAKLIGFELYPNIPRKPKEKILLIFENEKGKIFRPIFTQKERI